MTDGEMLSLEVQVGQLQKAVQMGFAETHRRQDAMERAIKDQVAKCATCKEGLNAEIITNEREARKREKQIHDNLEPRVRALEIAKGRAAAVVGFVGAVLGVLAAPLARLLWQKVFS